jgi:hypothetical protein
MKPIKIDTIVTLISTEQDVCKALAKRRTSMNRNNGVKNSKIGKLSDDEMDLEGMGAELAFCKLFNVFPDLTTHLRSSKDGMDGGDAILHNGMKVDVKSTTRSNGRLVTANWKNENEKVDLYCLMTGSFPTYTFRGFISSENIFQDKNWRNLGYGYNYVAEQDELKTLEEIIKSEIINIE